MVLPILKTGKHKLCVFRDSFQPWGDASLPVIIVGASVLMC